MRKYLAVLALAIFTISIITSCTKTELNETETVATGKDDVDSGGDKGDD